MDMVADRCCIPYHPHLPNSIVLALTNGVGMPTTTGLLKKGDRIKHKATGRVFVVVHRDNNSVVSQSVVVRPADSKPLAPGTVPAFGYPPNHFRLVEISFWLGRTYTLVEEETS